MSGQFESLVRGFAESKGLPPDDVSAGIEFVTDQESLLVVPHPARDDLLIIEVNVAEFGPDAEPLSREGLFLLHQINESARFEHDWLITIGSEGALQIHSTRSVSDTDVPGLEALMSEGLERAESLRDLLASMGSSDGPDQAVDAAAPSQFGGPFIRG